MHPLFQDLEEVECFIDDICNANTDCVNTDGTYYCECMQGYEYVQELESCIELDECIKNVHDCNDLVI